MQDLKKRDRLFHYGNSRFFNVFVHFGMIFKVIMAIVMIVGLWYFW